MAYLYSSNPKPMKIAVLIVYFGPFPEWYPLWRRSALLNPDIDFIVIQDQRDSGEDGNIHFCRRQMAEIGFADKTAKIDAKLSYAYKVCDYRPLFGVMFADLIQGYDYWGWGDLDVLYGDILGNLRDSFGPYDYVSTGFEGESGPLAFLKNTEKVTQLWRDIAGLADKLASDTQYAMDEKDFVELLKNRCTTDIVFRECLHDLPARWDNGVLRSVKSGKDYVLYHFGAGLTKNRKQISAATPSLMAHIEAGGAINISAEYNIYREYVTLNHF